ncbi:Pol polyprotein [Caligus rogercresseyi]|uniref:Pol polyprotein n=1 Tax=Caligus rogercresseyi TaxID=217165 RepID=A0A7T8K7X8_CALRO|nr:Pol polyprotein [Caligus rogercresseyi]
MRRNAFESLHSLSHPGASPTIKLVTDRFVWPSMKKTYDNGARNACIVNGPSSHGTPSRQ